MYPDPSARRRPPQVVPLWLSLPNATRRLGLPSWRATIRLIHAGHLVAHLEVDAKRWWVLRESVEQYRRQQRTPAA